MTTIADQQRDDHRPRLHHQGGGRQVDPDRLEQRVDPLGDRQAGEQPQHRPDDADHQRLRHHRGEDLPPRGAERAQHPELAHPLGDGDREGVEDHEGADEQGHAGEDEQGDGKEAEVVADLARLPVGVLLGGLDPDVRGHHLLDPRPQLGRGDALGRGDRDLVELADLVGDELRLAAGSAGRCWRRRRRRCRARSTRPGGSSWPAFGRRRGSCRRSRAPRRRPPPCRARPRAR